MSAIAAPSSPALGAYLRLERLADAADGEAPPSLTAEMEAAWQALEPAEISWLQSRRPETGANRFEVAARAKKVLALLRVVPTGETADQNRIIADFLGRLSVPDRARFAMVAKVGSPSDETWRQLIEEVLARRPI